MSKLEQLLDGVEVEWLTLKDVCIDFIVPMRDRPKVFDGDIPWCRIEDIVGQHFDKSLSGLCVSQDVIKKMNLKVFPTGTVICSCSASIGSYAINTQPLITNQTFIGLVCGDGLLNKFLFYFMETQTRELLKRATTGTIPYISRKKFEELPIPIPCPDDRIKSLAVQKEIVRILDTFTGLTAELKTELIARKKQFTHYHDQLLSFEGQDIEWKTLGEVGEFQRGKRFVKTDMISEGVPCIHYGEMYTYFGPYAYKTKSFVSRELVDRKKLRVAEQNDVVLVAAGETIEDIGMGTAWLGEEGAVTHDACFSFRSPLNPKYVAYFTRTLLFHNQIKKHIRTGKISAINEKGLSKAKIPVPSLDEQNRIVAILDKFDTLTTSDIEGLPAEIKLRHKQYEYYRDLLLTFPNPKD